MPKKSTVDSENMNDFYIRFEARAAAALDLVSLISMTSTRAITYTLVRLPFGLRKKA